MNILELKAADLGGAIAHVAASQLYQAMTEDDDEALGPRTWFGSDPDDGGGLEKDVLDLAQYVNGRDIPAEQLWRWGMLNGIVVREVDEFLALPLARRLAFEIFTDTCMRAHHRLELAQLDAQKMIPFDAPATPGLKLEDSIFEPHGSLGDQEEYQKQWMADQAAEDRRRLETEIAAAAAEAGGESQSLGTALDEQDEKPAGLSAGVKEEAGDETEAAEAGQTEGNAAVPDPSAQGSVPGVPDDLAAGQSVSNDTPEKTDELAAPVADAENGGAGAGAVPVNDKKTRKGKSAS